MIESGHTFSSARWQIDVSAGSSGHARPIMGTPGDDVVRANKGDNYIDVSQGGDDVVDGRSGDDTIYFGNSLTAEDQIGGFKGIDYLILSGDYSDGIDLNGSYVHEIEQIILTAGSSYSIAGDFDFENSYGFGYIDGSSLGSADSLVFDGSHAVVAVSVIAGSGDDTLFGGSSGSALIGGLGDDHLSVSGNGGVLQGDGGADILYSDHTGTIFSYALSTDSTRAAPDLIVGYQNGDHIPLAAVDADTKTPGHQAFHFGSTPGHVGDLIVHYNKTLDLTIVRAFTDGDAKADMEIHLAGHVPLTPDDFVL